MQSLTEKATRDAAAVKVLTIITLIYLPTTAVLVRVDFLASLEVIADSIELLLQWSCSLRRGISHQGCKELVDLRCSCNTAHNRHHLRMVVLRSIDGLQARPRLAQANLASNSYAQNWL
jgi:hypothetical protein